SWLSSDGPRSQRFVPYARRPRFGAFRLATKVALPSPAHAEASIPARASDLVARVMDTVSDLAVFGFASWTVLYHLGLIFDLHTDPLLLVWVLTLPLLLWWLVRSRDDAPADRVTGAAPGPRREWSRTNLVLAGSAVVLAAVSAALI